MALPTHFRRTRSHAPRPARRPRLTVAALDDRVVSAAFEFANGVFTINMDQVPSHSVVVGEKHGVVILNNRQSGGPTNSVIGPRAASWRPPPSAGSWSMGRRSTTTSSSAG